MDTIRFEDLSMTNLVPGRVYLSGDTRNYTRDEPIQRLFRFEGYRGIGNMGGIRRTMQQPPLGVPRREEAFVVLVNSGTQTNWPNIYDSTSGTLIYHGDNQTPGQDHLSTKQSGNKTFAKYFQRAYDAMETRIAPFFYFEKQSDRSVKYIGIAVPYVPGLSEDEALSLRSFQDSETGQPYDNLVARFTILEVTVTREWLIDLKHGMADSKYAPNEWLRFIAERDLSSRVEPPLTPRHRLCRERALENIGYRMTAFRRTQGRFRRDLLASRDCCELCGMGVESLLVASHIVPWSIADDLQRQDPDNGLLLCVTHDALFDKGFISFGDDGRILISETLPRQEWPRMNIDETMWLSSVPKKKDYMQLHRLNIFKTSSE